jgi:hypothetical protein
MWVNDDAEDNGHIKNHQYPSAKPPRAPETGCVGQH